MHLRTFCLPFYELCSLPIFSTFSMPDPGLINRQMSGHYVNNEKPLFFNKVCSKRTRRNATLAKPHLVSPPSLPSYFILHFLTHLADKSSDNLFQILHRDLSTLKALQVLHQPQEESERVSRKKLLILQFFPGQKALLIDLTSWCQASLLGASHHWVFGSTHSGLF